MLQQKPGRPLNKLMSFFIRSRNIPSLSIICKAQSANFLSSDIREYNAKYKAIPTVPFILILHEEESLLTILQAYSFKLKRLFFSAALSSLNSALHEYWLSSNGTASYSVISLVKLLLFRYSYKSR